MALVGCALRHDDEVDAAVGFFLPLFLGGFASAGGDARLIDALLDNVLLGEVSASLRQLGGLGLFAVCITDNDELCSRIILQAQSYVIAHALASIVKARGARFVVAAVAGLGRLW